MLVKLAAQGYNINVLFCVKRQLELLLAVWDRFF